MKTQHLRGFHGASGTRTRALLGAIQPPSHAESASCAALYGRAPGVPQHLPQQSAPRLAEARDPGCRRHRKGARASTSMVRRRPWVRVPQRASKVLQIADSDRTREAVLARIRRDVESGVDSGEVQGTPTLFVNGSVYRGPYDAATLVEVLSR